MLLASLSLSDIEAIEFLPPMDAMTRLGHAGQNGALLVTTRMGADRARSHRNPSLPSWYLPWRHVTSREPPDEQGAAPVGGS
jgi:hypothetical protein